MISGSIWGRSFTFRIKIYEEMAQKAMVRIRIVDCYGIAYALDKEYDVEPAEAKRLVEAKKAVPVKGSKLIENAAKKTPAKEKAVKI